MVEKVSWGVLGTARIARERVIPGLQKGQLTRVHAIASRDGAKGRALADALGVPLAYDSYEALLADPDIEVVYIPLPNNLHVPWAIRAMEAGKHVLCEKPIALTAQEAQSLVAARARTGRLVAEAMMVRLHPQWLRAKALVSSGEIGSPVAVNVVFSFSQLDAGNNRNKMEAGGGALYDIGVYAVVSGRFIFGCEPIRVLACVDRDPRLGIDRLTSAILDFGNGRQLMFVCGTQMAWHQRVDVICTDGRVEIPVPFNPVGDESTQLLVMRQNKSDNEVIGPSNHYTLQGDMMSKAVRKQARLAYPIEDAVATMRVIDALFLSGHDVRWATVEN